MDSLPPRRKKWRDNWKFIFFGEFVVVGVGEGTVFRSFPVSCTFFFFLCDGKGHLSKKKSSTFFSAKVSRNLELKRV